ncbi:MAG: NYN domain-containing protein [bacterium]
MTSKNLKVAVFIDGSNLYFKLKELDLVNLLHYDYRGLSQWLARDREIMSVSYYVGVVRVEHGSNKKIIEMRKSQQRLFAHLQSSAQNIQIKKGYLMKTNGIYHEKGVDVNLAVDLLVGAYENLYDVAIIISSDTDLIPAMRKVRELGKNIEYIGFAHLPSIALQQHADISRLLIKEDLEPFVLKLPLV